jgi:PilZ domain
MIRLEQRKAQRKKTFKPGQISLKNGGGFNCMIRNMSPFGACLQVVNHFGIPEDITLIIVGERFKRPCRIVWRGNNQVGVIFN